MNPSRTSSYPWLKAPVSWLSRHYVISHVLFLLCVVFPLYAEQSVPLIDLLPSTADRPAILQAARTSHTEAFQWVPLDAALLQSLRKSIPDASTNVCTQQRTTVAGLLIAQKLISIPRPGEEPFLSLLKLAEEQTNALMLDDALETLAAAREWVPCLSRPVTREETRRLFYLEGVVHTFKGDGLALPSFVEMLAVDPVYPLDPGAPSDVRQVYAQAQQTSRQTPVITFEGVKDGASWRVDGRELLSLTDLRPGRHIVQHLDAQGIRRSALAAIPTAKQDALFQQLASQSLATGQEAKEALGRALLTGQWQAEQKQSLEAFLNAQGLERLAFAVMSERKTGAEVKVYPSKPLLERQPGVDRAQVGLAVGVLHTVGLGDVRVVNDSVLGYAAMLEVPLGRTQALRAAVNTRRGGPALALAVGLYPHTLWDEPAVYECGGYSGGTPTETELEGALTCVESGWTFVGQLGLGYAIPVGPLTVMPKLLLEGRYLPSIIHPDDAGHYWAYDAGAGGILAALRLAYAVPGAPAAALTAELGAGVDLAWREGIVATTVPLTVAVGAITQF